MIPEVEAVVLAGGQGKRMCRSIEDHQKCMLPVEDRPILAHILSNIQFAFGTDRVIMSIGYKGDEIKDYFGSQYGRLELEYVADSGLIENKKALLQTKNLLHGPFFAIAGDVIIHPNHYVTMAEEWDRNKDTLGIVSVASNHTPAPTHAVIYTNNEVITKVHLYPDVPDASPDNYRDMTLQYFNHKMLTFFKDTSDEEKLISSVIHKQVESGRVLLTARYTLQWYHFVRPEDLNTTIIFTH